MLTLTCKNLELRGLVNKTNKDGGVYYIAYLETAEGEPHNFYVKDVKSFDTGLKKGDKVTCVFSLYYYDKQPKLNLVSIKKEV